MFFILASLPSQLVEFRRVSRFLRDRGELVRLFVDSERLLNEPGSELLPSGKAVRTSLRAWIAEKLSDSAFSRSVITSFNAATSEYERVRPSGVIVGEDGVGGNLAWIAAAKRKGIPVFVVPYEYSGIDQAIEAIRPNIGDYRVSGPIAWALAKWRPSWVKQIDGKDTLRLPLRFALGYEIAGVAPANPWTVHGGGADLLLAESPQMEQHYKNEAVPLEKIACTGSLAFDDLHRALQAAKPESDRLRILCALPPDYTGGRGPMPYGTLVGQWLDEARKHGNVTVQAHPAARTSLESIGVQCDTRDITALIAENDLLITSVSSIIRYALAAGRPVLNFDCYKFDYPDYVGAAGCVTVNSIGDFVAQFEQISSDFASYRTRAVNDAARWGVIDGKSKDRFAAALGLRSQTPTQCSERDLKATADDH